jgi:mono/diheme cytochrome c family protein
MSIRSALLLLCALVLASFAFTQVKVKNVPPKSVPAESGQAMYTAYCASCHGKDAKGSGPAAPAMKVAPTDLTTLSKRNKGVYPHAHVQHAISGEERIAAHGDKTMPVWGSLFSSMSRDSSQVQLRIANLTKYLEGLQEK